MAGLSGSRLKAVSVSGLSRERVVLISSRSLSSSSGSGEGEGEGGASLTPGVFAAPVSTAGETDGDGVAAGV